MATNFERGMKKMKIFKLACGTNSVVYGSKFHGAPWLLQHLTMARPRVVGGAGGEDPGAEPVVLLGAGAGGVSNLTLHQSNSLVRQKLYIFI